ncbi:MAG: pantoate--beta-alanine ligase [Luteolibacter sp.]
MTVADSGGALREVLKNSAGTKVLVPTMGALHEGHLELIRKARTIAGPDGTVIVSIFVNPIQFDRAADLAAYPRPLETDLAACEAEGVDVVFAPEAGSMYFADRSVTVTESLLSAGLCGATRPGHFDGVCTVVLKLFLLTGCDMAVFGEKDFQQLAIIRRMVRDLDVPVKIVGCPTIREKDGLAMSSRNVRLSPEQRADAPRIRRALLDGSKGTSVSEILETARAGIEASPLTRVDYLSLVDAETLQPVTQITRPALLATAVFYGDVRLIDNAIVYPAGFDSL